MSHRQTVLHSDKSIMNVDFSAAGGTVVLAREFVNGELDTLHRISGDGIVFSVPPHDIEYTATITRNGHVISGKPRVQTDNCLFQLLFLLK